MYFELIIVILVILICTLLTIVVIVHVNDKSNKNLAILKDIIKDLEKTGEAQENFLKKDKP